MTLQIDLNGEAFNSPRIIVRSSSEPTSNHQFMLSELDIEQLKAFFFIKTNVGVDGEDLKSMLQAVRFCMSDIHNKIQANERAYERLNEIYGKYIIKEEGNEDRIESNRSSE